MFVLHLKVRIKSGALLSTTNSNNCNFQHAQYLEKLENKNQKSPPLFGKFYFSASLLIFQSSCTLALLYKAKYTCVYITNFHGFCVFQNCMLPIIWNIPGTFLCLLLFTGSKTETCLPLHGSVVQLALECLLHLCFLACISSLIIYQTKR